LKLSNIRLLLEFALILRSFERFGRSMHEKFTVGSVDLHAWTRLLSVLISFKRNGELPARRHEGRYSPSARFAGLPSERKMLHRRNGC